ncbi:MAG: hypothetical protein JXQ90_04835 [Cyclobacteriaceae bacterium]
MKTFLNLSIYVQCMLALIGTTNAQDGVLIFEAEKFDSQELNEIRSWEIIKKGDKDQKQAAATASKGKYVQLLPDTRVTHDDKLIPGENFMNTAGKMCVLNYKVKIDEPGKYYVWVRAFSTGPEDNGIHVGLDGEWPDSGNRMQWCEGKHEWTWASKQRTKEVHCGVEELIYIEIREAGEHTVSFSMREDGFAFDQWALTKEYVTPE